MLKIIVSIFFYFTVIAGGILMLGCLFMVPLEIYCDTRKDRKYKFLITK